MAAVKKIRRRAGTTVPGVGAVQVPLQTEDLLAAVVQLQASLNEVITRYNAHAVAAHASANLVTGTAVTDTNLFVAAATT